MLNYENHWVRGKPLFWVPSLNWGLSVKADQWISAFVVARNKTIQSSSKSQFQAMSQKDQAWIIGYNNEEISSLGIPAQSCLGIFPTQNFARHTGIFCTLKKDASWSAILCLLINKHNLWLPKLSAANCSWSALPGYINHECCLWAGVCFCLPVALPLLSSCAILLLRRSYLKWDTSQI